MCGLIFYSFIPCENPQWAMPCYSKTDLALRYLSLERKKKGVFSLVKIGLGPMKSVHLGSLRGMCGQNLIWLTEELVKDTRTETKLGGRKEENVY